MSDRERDIALCEAHEITAEDEYFAARPENDFPRHRVLFMEGFKRGWQAAQATPEPVCDCAAKDMPFGRCCKAPKDLIEEILQNNSCKPIDVNPK